MAQTSQQQKARLAGKVAIVTGAGRGIGREEALLLASQGAKVVVNDVGRHPGETAQDVVNRIRETGGEAEANNDSVASMEGAARLIDTAVAKFGRLDILVNNAGVIAPGEVSNLSEEDWDKVILVHLKGTFATIRHASPVFKRQRSGAIVNTGSESGLGHPAMGNYSAATLRSTLNDSTAGSRSPMPWAATTWARADTSAAKSGPPRSRRWWYGYAPTRRPTSTAAPSTSAATKSACGRNRS